MRTGESSSKRSLRPLSMTRSIAARHHAHSMAGIDSVRKPTAGSGSDHASSVRASTPSSRRSVSALMSARNGMASRGSSRLAAITASERPSAALAFAMNVERRFARSAAARAARSAARVAVLFRLPPRELGEQKELDEDLDLRAQDLGDDRRYHEVDGAQRVALRNARFVAVVRRDEYDRNVRRALAAAYQRGRLEAVDSRHVDVEENDREFVLEDLLQRVFAGRHVDEVLAEFIEDRAEHDVLVGPVVDDEDIGAFGHDRAAGALSRLPARRIRFRQRPSHAWSTPIISSVSTGFDR